MANKEERNIYYRNWITERSKIY